MAQREYVDLDVTLEHGNADYVSIVRSAGQGDDARTAFANPVNRSELEALLARLPAAGRGSGTVSKLIEHFSKLPSRPTDGSAASETRDEDRTAFEEFGGFLFDALFRKQTHFYLRSVQREANKRGLGLRIRLHLAAVPELAYLPWEFLYDTEEERFLGMSAKTPIVRYPDQVYASHRPMPVEPPLKILVVIASPSDYEELGLDKLDVEREWGVIHTALADLERTREVILERLETATLEALRHRLRPGGFHVLHFVGHGFGGSAERDGELVLVDAEGKGRRVSGETLGDELRDRESLRLVVLNSCLGGRATISNSLAGTAQRLVRSGVPAVIGMQFAITDPAAIAFASEFYRALADADPVDAAVAEARKAVSDKSGLEWATPTLYMRSHDGHLWDLSPITDEQRRENEVATLREETQDSIDRGDLQTAMAKLDELARRIPGDPIVEQRIGRIRLQLQADDHYADGLERTRLGQWREAYDAFRRVLNLRGGNYKDVLERLETSRRALHDGRVDLPPGRDERLVAEVAEAIGQIALGKVVLILGPDANLSGRPTGGPAIDDRFLPSSRELARYLADENSYPDEQSYEDLVRVAQFVEAKKMLGPVYDAVRGQLRLEYPATPLHHILARLPAVLRASNTPEPLVFMTTNYDDGLEIALEQAREPYDTVVFAGGGAADDGQPTGGFLHKPWRESPRSIAGEAEARKYIDVPVGGRRVVVVKILGKMDRDDQNADSYVITEDQHVDYYFSSAVKSLPVGVTQKLVNKHFLFLGFSLREWYLRAFLRMTALTTSQAARYYPWVIMPNATELDRLLWQSASPRAHILDASLDDYMAQMSAAMDARLAATSAQLSTNGARP
jgi:hypothetical protein